MKTKLQQKVGLSILAFSLLCLLGCKHQIDTVETLETPNLQGKAYPGMNYIYWDKIANAKNGYRLDIYEDDILINEQSKEFDENTTYFVDTDLQNGVEKKYVVSAIGDAQARAIYFKESEKGSISLTAIVPAFTTSALSMADYETSHSGVTLSEDTITVSQNTNSDSFYVSFPAKPYLTYKIYAEYGNSYEILGHSTPVAAYENASISCDKIVTVEATVATSGEYSIYVEAASVNKKYTKSDEVKAKNTISFSTINLSTSYAALIDEEMSAYTSETSAIIYWTPAKLLNGSYVPTYWYKIYKTITGENDYSLLTNKSSVTEYTSVTSTDKLYYIIDNEIDSTKTYTYKFVISNGNGSKANIYSEASSSILKTEIDDLPSDITAVYKDKSTVKVSWTPNILGDGSQAPATAYTLSRKVKGSDDSTYEKVSASTTETTVFGTTTYSIEDTISDNTVAYVYLLSIDYKDTTYQKVVTIPAYKIVYEAGNTEMKVSYIKDDTARILWIPDEIEGKTLESSNYKLYRKGYYKDDSDYTVVNAEINTAYNQNNETVYYVDSEITDTTSAYTWLLEYKYENTIYQTTEDLESYSKAVKLTVPEITLFAAETDGIENDVQIDLKVSAEQKISDVKYILLDASETAELLDADYPNELETSNATITEEDDITTYSWIIPNVEEGKYVSVAAIVDNNAQFATTEKAAASEPEFTTSEEGSGISIDFVDSDKDGLKDDAFVIITLADKDKVISGAAYGSSDSLDSVILATEMSFTEGYCVYAFTVVNAVTPEAPFFVIEATISEEGKKDVVITKNAIYENASSELLFISLNFEDADDDGLANDVYLSFFGRTKEESITATYAVANTAENAKLLLDSSHAKTLGTFTGYLVYEITSDDYAEFKDISLDKYVAVRLTGTEKNTTEEYVIEEVTEDPSLDEYADVRTDAPDITMNLIADDEDGVKNDIYATIELNKTQNLEELLYTNATENSDSLILRLFSEKGKSILSKAAVKYTTTDKKVYEVLLKDFDEDTVIALKATAGETGKVSAYDISRTQVTAEVVTMTETAEIELSKNYLTFAAKDYDANYNDINNNENIYLTLGIDQSIKSARMISAETIDAAKAALAENSTLAGELYIPSSYQLNTSVSDGLCTLTKTYSIYPNVYRGTSRVGYDVPEGNTVVVSIIISEPGYLDREIFLTPAAWTKENSYPVTESFEVPAYSWQRPVQKPYSFTVDDSKNYEYVHVQIADYFIDDEPDRYTYSIERTYEDTYYNSDTVWETIDSDIVLDYDYGFYKFDKWYKDITVRDYVYRLTKTRKSTEEKQTVDREVTVIYNTVAPELAISSYESENIVISSEEYMDPNYDHLDKYDYSLSYDVKYYDASGWIIYQTDEDGNECSSMTYELTDWTWEAKLDEDSKETGYYTMKDAVISGIEKYNNDCARAVITVYLEKDRNDVVYYYHQGSTSDSTSTTIQLNWGLSASIAATSDISVNCYEQTISSTTWLVVTADSGYDSYEWYVDSEYYDEDENSLWIGKNSLTYGSHDILVKAKKDGVTYSASISYTK